MGRDLVRIIVAVLVFVVVAGTWYVLGGGAEGVQAGQRAPNFTLGKYIPPTTDGDADTPVSGNHEVELATLRGQPVFINFWATWCPPCRWEMPYILETQKSRPDVHVLVINVGETEEEIAAYLAEVGLEELNVLRDKGFEVYGQYHLTGLPTSLFLNKRGTICTRYAGAMSLEMIQTALNGASGDC